MDYQDFAREFRERTEARVAEFEKALAEAKKKAEEAEKKTITKNNDRSYERAQNTPRRRKVRSVLRKI